jgi:hypothetical protein
LPALDARQQKPYFNHAVVGEVSAMSVAALTNSPSDVRTGRTNAMMICRAAGTTLVSAVTTEAENDQRCWLTREMNLDPSVKIIHN